MSVNKKITEVNSFELYFEWFLNELKDAGYVESYHREPFSLMAFEKSLWKRYSFATKKPKIEDFSIMPDAKYTMDYLVVWTEKGNNIFYTILSEENPKLMDTPFYAFINRENKIVSLCDVKPASGASIYGNNSAGYTFPLFQKILWNMHGIYVNKVIPIPYVQKGEIKSGNAQALFSGIFCPRRFIFTDGGKQPRKINYKIRTLADYVAIQQKELNRRMTILHSQQTLL